MTTDVNSRTQTKVRGRNVDQRPPRRMQHLSGSKNRSGGWVRAEQPTEGAMLMGHECWRRKLPRASEHQDAGEEKMSDGETSSTCSSDPGLFTNDEGRQGDDEQSDWFVEGECGVRAGVTSLRPTWDSDRQQSLKDTCSSATFLHPAQPSRRGYCSHLATTASCSVRKERRRIPSKGGRIPVFVRRLKHLSEDRYQRGFWLSSFGSQEKCQVNPLCPSPIQPIDMVSENSHLRRSSSIRTNRQININPQIVCAEDMRRRRRSSSVISACRLSHKDKQ
ncbi:hypothetical protein WMY93_016486 [Mugilogobius chulae]|uniref:DUF4685 domain-containing protein n=1 Tax=Mugilogobius chulae TaxID=88201 RepID=A0AAW0NS12_9GOBI